MRPCAGVWNNIDVLTTPSSEVSEGPTGKDILLLGVAGRAGLQ